MQDADNILCNQSTTSRCPREFMICRNAEFIDPHGLRNYQIFLGMFGASIEGYLVQS
jgi:hypothetical protein